MANFETQRQEFENNYTSVISEDVIQLAKTFDSLYDAKKSRDILTTIDLALAMLKESRDKPTQMQINYDIGSAYQDLRVLSQENDEAYLEKEIYYLRVVLDIFEMNFCDDDLPKDAELKVARYIAMRAYTNIGNAMHVLGRYIAAIDYFKGALLIDNGFSMASLNLSFSLFRYAQMQLNPYDRGYYYHACFHYYEQTKRCKISLESTDYLEELEKIILQFPLAYIDDYLKKPLDLPLCDIDDSEEKDYRDYLAMSRLFLNPCLDILSAPCFAVDSINLPFGEKPSEKELEFIGLFNQIKQEYNLARYLWYSVSTDTLIPSFPDQGLDLLDTGDCADYSLKEGLLRAAFKLVYSLFDRIGFFINQYFQVGLPPAKVSFKNVWKNELRDEKGKVYYVVPQPIMRTYGKNPLIKAMYWLQKDFFKKKTMNITSPSSEPIFQMRNDMEHNCLRTGVNKHRTNFTKHTSCGIIEDNTYKLLHLSRELIIYLCLSISYELRIPLTSEEDFRDTENAD